MPLRRTAGRRITIGGVEDDDNEEEELEERALTREAGDGNHDLEEDNGDDEGRLDNNDNDDVGHLCALYRTMLSGSFCPRARCILLPVPVPLDDYGGGDARDDGDVGIAPGILPLISALLGHPSTDPAGAAFSRDAPEMDGHRHRMMSSVQRSCLYSCCCGPTTRGLRRVRICSTCRMTSAGWTIAVRSSIPLPQRTTTTATTGGM